MKWYRIYFSFSDLSADKDNKFISEFVKLLHTLHHPDDLALFSLKFQSKEGLTYYSSSPDELAYKIKELLAYYPSQQTSTPDVNLLTLQLGKCALMPVEN